MALSLPGSMFYVSSSDVNEVGCVIDVWICSVDARILACFDRFELYRRNSSNKRLWLFFILLVRC
jgi:hypothetical protein